jgi:hypothetical protein
MAALAGCVASAGPGPVVTPGNNGAWGRAATVPGLPEGFSAVTSVSCTSGGDCLAGGSSAAGAFVVSEVNRRWGAVHLIGGTMTIDSVSCASPGNCAAAGTRREGRYHTQAFVISQTHGSWGAPVTVRGPASMGRDQHVVITSVSCGAPGECSAGGALSDDGRQPFVISEVRGTWSAVQELPGLAALNIGHDPQGTGISSISCTSAGDCSAAGTYASGFYVAQGFVVSAVHGTWGTAIEVPGSPTGSKDFGATMPSLSCGSPGNCVAVENYEHGLNVPSQPLLVSQVDGTWRPAMRVPGLRALGAVNADLSAVSCGSAGNCTAGGQYSDMPWPHSHRWLFAVSEENGAWRPAARINLPAARTRRDNPEITSLSCDSAGNCAAGGVYGYSGFGTVAHYQGFVASEAGGRWGAARQIPGAAALNTAWDSQVLAVSCDPAGGGCLAGGYYSDHPHANSKNHPYDQHAFLTTERRRAAVS